MQNQASCNSIAETLQARRSPFPIAIAWDECQVNNNCSALIGFLLNRNCIYSGLDSCSSAIASIQVWIPD
jgi:hypothetical protein